MKLITPLDAERKKRIQRYKISFSTKSAVTIVVNGTVEWICSLRQVGLPYDGAPTAAHLVLTLDRMVVNNRLKICGLVRTLLS